MNTKSLGMSNFPIRVPFVGRQVILLTTFILIFRVCALGSISISGTYLGKNLRVSNPVSEDGFGYAITKVVVNEKVIPLKCNGEMAEIDFSYIGLQPGNPVTVIIRTQNERCLTIQNPESLGSPVITTFDENVHSAATGEYHSQSVENEDPRIFRRARKFVPENR